MPQAVERSRLSSAAVETHPQLPADAHIIGIGSCEVPSYLLLQAKTMSAGPRLRMGMGLGTLILEEARNWCHVDDAVGCEVP
jgi:hypothetical protein